MIYIYDVLLNFNNELHEFYEWDKNDTFYHLKKIPLYKIDSKIMNDLIYKKVKMDVTFIIEIFNKSEVYESKKIKNISYACLFTDSYRVIGLLFDRDGTVLQISDLLLDEAMDIIEISDRCKETNLEYTTIGKRKEHVFFTRYENRVRLFLMKEINNTYRGQDFNKLKYLYFEYFNKTNDNIEDIYLQLINSFSETIDKKHLRLYELVRLSRGAEVKYKI